MAHIYPGRYTAMADEPFIVFAIGMRLNRLWAVHRWLRPVIDTCRIVRLMSSAPPDGYLGGQLFFYWRGVGILQYWRGFDQLEAFAKDRDQPHLAAWRHLLNQTESDQTFGYWHETYRVDPRSYECIYGSMPRFGLAAATRHIPLTERIDSARDRLGPNSLAQATAD